MRWMYRNEGNGARFRVLFLFIRYRRRTLFSGDCLLHVNMQKEEENDLMQTYYQVAGNVTVFAYTAPLLVNNEQNLKAMLVCPYSYVHIGIEQRNIKSGTSTEGYQKRNVHIGILRERQSSQYIREQCHYLSTISLAYVAFYT